MITRWDDKDKRDYTDEILKKENNNTYLNLKFQSNHSDPYRKVKQPNHKRLHKNH